MVYDEHYDDSLTQGRRRRAEGSSSQTAGEGRLQQRADLHLAGRRVRVQNSRQFFPDCYREELLKFSEAREIIQWHEMSSCEAIQLRHRSHSLCIDIYTSLEGVRRERSFLVPEAGIREVLGLHPGWRRGRGLTSL